MRSLLVSMFNPFLIPKLIWNNHFLLYQLVQRNFIGRYKGSALGIIWSIVQPLLMLLVYTFVFTFVLKCKFGIPLEDERPGAFSVIMFAGMTVFNIFSEAVNNSSVSIIGNQNFVKKVIFPLELLPIAQVISSVLFGIIWFGLLFLGNLFILKTLSWTMLFLPLILVPLILFSLGVSFIAASLTVYLKDTPYIIMVLLQIMFFMTPIFYPVTAVPEKFRLLLYLNPLSEIVEQIRLTFLYGLYPNYLYVGILWLGSALVCQLGFLWFNKTKKGFADVI